MKGEIEDFGTGWFGLRLGIKESEIDQLIAALTDLRSSRSHFHIRSSFEGKPGIGDIELYWTTEEGHQNLEVDSSAPVDPNERRAEPGAGGNAD